jgi:hypothetical protein
MIRFTPGVWIHTEDGRLGNVETVDGEQIAMAQPRAAAGKPDPEREANAQLIAASPDLLFAVIAILRAEWHANEDQIVAARDLARQAVDKAIGKGGLVR